MNQLEEKAEIPDTGSGDYLPLDGPPIHHREIKIESCRTSRNTLQIRSELHDYLTPDNPETKPYRKVHNKVLRLEIDPATHTIIAAEFGMPTGSPHTNCAALPVGADKLIGLSAGANLTRNAMRLYRRTNGCTHILSLILATVPAIHQANAFLVAIPDLKKESAGEDIKEHFNRNKFTRNLQNACHVLTAENLERSDYIDKIVNFSETRGD